MKAIKNFLSYVEISTKIASLLPFFVGTGYAMYRYGCLQYKQTLIFFVAMLLFDMTTTALNNHVGHRQTGRTPHYSTIVSISIILFMGISATLLGIYLVYITDIMILLVGVFCFGVGIIYNYGFLPISRTPFGELVSGSVMGICIPFIAVEINRSIINITLEDFNRLTISLDWLEIVALVIVVIPLICCIANIMLANNICDVNEDVMVHRYTLPFYIGVDKSIILYKILYITGYIFIIIASIFNFVPLFTLIALFSIIPVWKNIVRFSEVQDKQQTFFLTIINFLMILVPYASLIWLGSVF